MYYLVLTETNKGGTLGVEDIRVNYQFLRRTSATEKAWRVPGHEEAGILGLIRYVAH